MARIAGVDLPREKRVEIGLTYIYGIGRASAQAILDQSQVASGTKVGDLTDDQVTQLRNIIESQYRVEGSLRGEVNMNIKFAQINFIDGRAHCFGEVDVVIDMDISLEAEITVDEEGEPDITIHSLHVGRLPVPGTLVDQVMRAVMNNYQERLDSIDVDLEEITIGDGEMIIRGRSR